MNRHLNLLLKPFIFVAALWSAQAHAVPAQMTYTGYLTLGKKPYNSTGLTGVFKVFSQATGGLSPEWDETIKNVLVKDGVFTVTLGKSKVLGAHVFKGTLPKYAEIVLGGQTMSPRVPLLTVPHAFSASNCTGHLTPKSVSMGGKEVINSSGAWVGPVSSASEKDPVFLKSPAGSISPAQVSSWDSAAGCAKGAISANRVPRCNGAKLVNSTIYDNGNVGIGTGKPSAKLDVNGEVRLTGSELLRGMHGSALSLVGGVTGNHIKIQGASNQIQYSATTHAFKNAGGQVDFLRITDIGKVGIGKTNPYFPLDVAGAINTSNEYVLSGGNARITNSQGTEWIKWTATGGGGDIVVATANKERVRISNTGKVGIGKTSPYFTLDVAGAINTNSEYVLSGKTGKARITNGQGTEWIKWTATGGGGDIVVATANKERVRISNTGKVGIGTSKPSATLDMRGDLYLEGPSIQIGSVRTATDSSPFLIYASKTRGGSGGPVKKDDDVLQIDARGYETSGSGGAYRQLAAMKFSVDGPVSPNNVPGRLTFWTRPAGSGAAMKERIRIDSNGNVGIGTASTGAKLYVAGLVVATKSCNCSDRRWKKNVAPLKGSLEKVSRLNGVSYHWRVKDYPGRGFTKGRKLGLIAQEVEKVLPEVVHTGDDGYKAVSYEKITPLLIEAIKEQQRVIKQQQKQYRSLLARVAALEAGDSKGHDRSRR